MDEAQKPAVMQRQRDLLEARYDLSDRPMPGAMMSGGRKAVQDGVRVKLPDGPDLGRARGPDAERNPRPGTAARRLHAAAARQAGHAAARSFPNLQIDAIAELEQRDLRRFDVDFDLPEHLTPEFPPPIFLTTHPELGDVSRGQLLTIRNFYEMMDGIVTPVQMEGCACC